MNPALELDPAPVYLRKHLGARVVTLNRPQALNSLNLEMIRSMTPQLQAWERSDLCHIIILKATGQKAFCAGGDVKVAVEMALRKDPAGISFFKEEYVLNHLIGTIRKPMVAIMNGITMGGGVGLSVHAPLRIATEHTVFAMPETAIGLFPDVGGSFFLSRMGHELGTFLGLTGIRLKGTDVYKAGVATHFVPSVRLAALEERLYELEAADLATVTRAVDEFVGDFSPFSLQETLPSIERCFQFDKMEEIINALQQENTKWSRETLSSLAKMSPTSLKVTLALLRKGARLSFKECLNLEFHLVNKFYNLPDFHEGVRAVLIEKTGKPCWQPDSLAKVEDAFVEAKFFSNVANRLSFLNPIDYKEYPRALISP